MTKPNFAKIANTVKNVAIKYGPEILTGIGVTGMLTSTILAVKVTPKAVRTIEDLKRYDSQAEEIIEPTKKEIVKATWKYYIPAAVTAAASATCLIGASATNYKRNAALATAYKLSETALAEYKDAVIETIGEKQDEVIRDKVSKKKVEEASIGKNEIFITEKDNTICLEPLFNRYFKSDSEKIQKVVNTLNERILSDPFNSGVSLIDFYDELGLSTKGLEKTGDKLGWSLNKGTLKIYISAQVAEEGSPYEGKPILVLNYINPPTYDF